MPDPVSVTFEYRAPTEVPPSILENYRQCSLLVGRTHIHASWREYQLTTMKPEGEMLFVAEFHDVPVGRHRIRVSDPNACPLHVTGAVTAHVVYANGVLLTRKVDTPGTGTEPGFGFTVDEAGNTRP